jgi:hypothetical protein
MVDSSQIITKAYGAKEEKTTAYCVDVVFVGGDFHFTSCGPTSTAKEDCRSAQEAYLKNPDYESVSKCYKVKF